MEAYLDNSATTRVCDRAVQKMVYMMQQAYGNPSSLHRMGLEANEIRRARESVARARLRTRRAGVYVRAAPRPATLRCSARRRACKARQQIVVSAYEHSSVLAAAARLAEQGFETVQILPDESGVIRPADVLQAVDEKTILVSVMQVNNETGALNDVARIARLVKTRCPVALFHTDLVQGFCKAPLALQSSQIDLATVSGHKIHAPKGVGALYIKKGARILPVLYGGEQQGKIRPGTESAPLICAFGEAAARAWENRERDRVQIEQLAAHLRARVQALEGVAINSPDGALPHIVNLSVPGIRSEIMLHFLEQREVYVSSGSACAKGGKSHVLTAMGLSPARIDSALRVSFSEENTLRDVDRFVDGVILGMNTLSRSK
ncbi:MAG: cysteine desulfurase family protein [Oscillospiraceae bacterium]